MTVEELIDALTEMVDCGEVTPDAEVRLAIQPSWPFEHSAASVVVPTANCEQCEVEPGAKHEDGCPAGPGIVGPLDPSDPAKVVYVGEGQQLGYLPGTARDALGWSE